MLVVVPYTTSRRPRFTSHDVIVDRIPTPGSLSPLIFIKIPFKKILSNLNNGANPFFFLEQMEAKTVSLSNLIPQ